MVHNNYTRSHQVNNLVRVEDQRKASNSLLTYQIFYETLEESKHKSQFLYKPRSKYTSLRRTGGNITGLKKKEEQIILDEDDLPPNDKINESNNSIKDLVFNDDLEKAFDDNMSEDHLDNNEILRNLEEERFNYQKKEQAEVYEVEENNQQFPEPYSYMNVNKFPYYLNTDNQILLKASSLFDNSILMNNDHVTTYCKTFKKEVGGILNVIIELTFKPKREYLSLSTELLSIEKVYSEPHIIERESLDNPVQQTFAFTFDKTTMLKDFPKLKIDVLDSHSIVDSTVVPIPYSINKFTLNYPFTIDDINYFLEYVG